MGGVTPARVGQHTRAGRSSILFKKRGQDGRECHGHFCAAAILADAIMEAADAESN